MNLSIFQTGRQKLAEHKVAVIVITVVVGFAIGVWLSYWSQLPAKPRTVPQLVRALQKQDSPYLYAWATVWTLLPDSVTRRCPSLEPRPASTIRLMAAAELADRRSNAVPAIPVLVKAFLEDPDFSVRTAAIETLRELGPLAEAAVPPLLTYFNDRAQKTVSGSPVGRAEAGVALAEIAPKNPQVADSLLTALQAAQDPVFCAQIIGALGTLQAPSESIVRTLIRFSESSPSPLREPAVVALGELGPDAAAAVPSLIQSFEQLETEPDPPPPDQTPPIVRHYRSIAAVPGNMDAVSQTFAARVDADYSASLAAAERHKLRCRIIEALGNVGPKAQLALPLLIREATNAARPYVGEAAYAQWQIQRDADAVLPLFANHLKENVPLHIQCRALEYLARLGPDGFPVLLPLLEQSSTTIRFTVVRALGELGRAAQPAVARLESLVESDSKNAVRLAAAEALAQIDPTRATNAKRVLLTVDGQPFPTNVLSRLVRHAPSP